MKREKEELMTELKKWENGVQLIECGHIERAQKKLYNEDKSLRTAKDTQQRMVSLIADLKVLKIKNNLFIEWLCERSQDFAD